MFGTEIENKLAAAESSKKNQKFINLARRKILAEYGLIDPEKGMYRDPAKDLGPPPPELVADEVVDLGDSFGG